ncbi:MAG: hypothetical protein F6K58_16475 [Symploca sp. SIO2E9]|nr:hypothetical protein [Symploca sp. SIO2E9]
MNPDNFLQLLQTGIRASLGATTLLVETLQDPRKREDSFSQLHSDLNQQLSTWAEKGEQTEQEARSFLDQLLSNPSNSGSTSVNVTSDQTSATPTTSTTSPHTQSSLEDLTAQIAALRTELEQLRQSDSNS